MDLGLRVVRLQVLGDCESDLAAAAGDQNCGIV